MCDCVYLILFCGDQGQDGTWKIEGAFLLLHECMFEV